MTQTRRTEHLCSDFSYHLSTLDPDLVHPLGLGESLGFESLEVAHHGIPREFLARDKWVLFQRTLDEGVATGLVEKGNAVSFAIVVVRFAGSFDAVERRFEAVVGPRHQEVADVADDGVGRWVGGDFGPCVPMTEGRRHFTAWADLGQTMSASRH